MASRVYAFKDAVNMYWIYNSAKTSLIGISFDPDNPDYSRWEDASNLDSLTTDQLKLVSGLTLCLYSYIEDDDYTVDIDSYTVTQTTDESHYLLKGYKTINSIAIDGSADCKVLLSFDGRKTWVYYDTTTSTWVTTLLKNIYTDAMTVTQVNALTSTQFDMIFTRGCTLDYAITVASDQYLTSVALNLPSNTVPTVSGINILYRTSNETHKDKITVEVEIDDPDDDDVTYEVSFTNGTHSGVLYSGDLPTSYNHKYTYVIDPNDLFLGTNVITIKATDEVSATGSGTINIIKTNEQPIIAYSFNKGVITAAITDKNDDDKVKYRVIVNGVHETEWSDLEKSVFSFTYKIPNAWINFGETNTVKIEFVDDVSDPTTQSVDFTFEGEYFGILFIKPDEPEFLDSGKMNKDRYYSDSLGETINKLLIPNIIYTKESSTYEIGIINNSDTANLPEVEIKSEIINEHYKILLSKVTPFVGQEILTFKDLNIDGEPRLFYVKLISYDKFTSDVNGYITANSEVPVSNGDEEES